MKLLVLLSVAACSTAQLADPFFGIVPFVQPRGNVVLKTAESAEPAAAETPTPVPTFPFRYPLVYNYPFLPTTNVISAAADKAEASKVITYSASPFLSYHTPLLKTITPEVEVDDDDDDDDAEVNPLAFLSKPLLYYGSHVPVNYGNHIPLTYSYSPFSPLTFPAIPTVALAKPEAAATEPAAAAEPAAISARRKRDIQVPLPFLRAVPDEHKVEYKTNQLVATDDATPADTTKLELTSKTHELSIPTVKYVQDVVSIKPVTYSAPLVTSGGYYPFTYSAYGRPFHYPLTYSGHVNPYVPFAYSGLHPYGFPFYGYSVAAAESAEAKPEASAEPTAEVVAE